MGFNEYVRYLEYINKSFKIEITKIINSRKDIKVMSPWKRK